MLVTKKLNFSPDGEPAPAAPALLTLPAAPATFPFAPSLNEWRIYYRFLLLHPGREPGMASAFADDAARLRVVNALAIIVRVRLRSRKKW